MIIDYFSDNLSTQTGLPVQEAIDREKLSRLLEKNVIRVALEIADRDSR